MEMARLQYCIIFAALAQRTVRSTHMSFESISFEPNYLLGNGLLTCIDTL